MKGCMIREVQYVYSWKMAMICNCCLSGAVGVCGGDLVMMRIIFFCNLCSGCIYVAVCESVPHIVMPYMRCGYMSEKYSRRSVWPASV